MLLIVLAIHISCEKEDNTTLQRLIQPLSKSYDMFGYSVAINEDYCLIAALDKNIGSVYRSGACYFYKKNKKQWNYHQTIALPIPQSDSYYGKSIAISKNYAVVAAYGQHMKDTSNRTHTGVVYIYKLSGMEWVLSQTIDINNSNYNNITFGVKVAISDSILAVSALNPAEVFIYTLNNDKWELKQTIKNKPCVFFGMTLSAYKNNLLIGSGGICNDVFVYEISSEDGFMMLKSIIKSTNKSGTFGTALTMNENFVFIGEEEALNTKTSIATGCVYVYKISNNSEYKLISTLFPPLTKKKIGFGSRLSASENYLIVSAFAEPIDTNKKFISDSLLNAGAIYIYKNEKKINWTLFKKVKAPRPHSWDKFGFSIQIHKNNVVIGSRLEDSGKKSDVGAAYIYTLP